MIDPSITDQPVPPIYNSRAWNYAKHERRHAKFRFKRKSLERDQALQSMGKGEDRAVDPQFGGGPRPQVDRARPRRLACAPTVASRPHEASTDTISDGSSTSTTARQRRLIRLGLDADQPPQISRPVGGQWRFGWPRTRKAFPCRYPRSVDPFHGPGTASESQGFR